MLKKIFGPKKETGENCVRSCIICTPYQKIMSRRMRQVGHVVRLGEKKNGYRFLVGKTCGKRTLEQTGVDGTIIKRILEGSMGVHWINLAQERDDRRVLVNAANFLTS